MISILISSFRGGAAIELCIESILKRTKYPNYKIIVYDSSGEGRDKDYLMKQRDAGNIRLYGYETPVDHGYAIEQLLKICDTEFACILDSDVEILDDSWLSYFIDRVINNNILGMGRLRSGSRVFMPDAAYAPIYWAACLFLNMDAYQRLGFSGSWRHKKIPLSEYKHNDLVRQGNPEYIYYDTGAEFTEKILHDNPGQLKMLPLPLDYWKKMIYHYGAISRNWGNPNHPEIKRRLAIIESHLELLRNKP